jgi:hypothetical protein
LARHARAFPVFAGMTGIQSLAGCWIPAFAGMTVKALMIGHDFDKTQ